MKKNSKKDKEGYSHQRSSQTSHITQSASNMGEQEIDKFLILPGEL